jgi:hypothetical protein
MNVDTVACPTTKKKRSLVVDGDDAMEISFSKRSQVDMQTIPSEISSTKDKEGSRKARFVLYYMTTTLTSTSTSTSTSSSYTATYTVSLLSCTPSGVLATMCG